MKSRIILSFLGLVLLSLCCDIHAQTGTNSPYSQYGLGLLSEQSQGFNHGMGGLALGLRKGTVVNYLNPASYSAVDSLTMIFDVGLYGQVTNFNENGRKLNARNADFEYAVGSFRIMPHLGLGFGVIPFSNVEYSYSNTTSVGSSSIVSTESHKGTGGFHQAFLGLGWQPISCLSIGANVSYFWGNYDRSISIASSDGYVNTIVKSYISHVNNYKVDFGVQWQQILSSASTLVVGATYGMGHNLKADVEARTTSTNSQTAVVEEQSLVLSDALSVPHTFGLGAAYSYGRILTVGADYTLQKWGSLDFPEMDDRTGAFVKKRDLLADRHRLTLGGEYVPNIMSTRFFDRIHYRLGASYTTPYVKVNGQDGPREVSISAGFGIPIVNHYNNRSMLNVSGQWVRVTAPGLITENTFRLNVGITFNERWFMKWKVE